MKTGKQIFGSDPEGRDIYKDTKGYYVVDWSPEKGDFKLYIKAKGLPKTPIAKLTCTRKNGKETCKWKLTKTRKNTK